MDSQSSLNIIKKTQSSQKSTLHLQKVKNNQNSIFLSKQQRFSHNNSRDNSPGPGSYIDPLARSRQIQKNLQQSKNKKSSSNHLDKFVSREHQWIFGNNRFNSINKQYSLGPGAYNLQNNLIKKNFNLQTWSKSERFNGTQWKSSQNSLGPGSYDARLTNIKQRKTQMGIFKSKSPKTFLQQLQKRIVKNSIQKQIINQFQTNRSELQQMQKLAQSQQKNKKIIKMDPIFISKSKRYDIKNPQTSKMIGPGSYNINIESNQSILKKKVTTITHSTHQIKKKVVSEHSTNPGPTSYNVEQFNIEKQVMKKITSAKGSLPLQTRFKYLRNQINKTEVVPGPGHYGRQKYIFINQKQYQHKPLVSHHQKVEIPFLSSSPRGNFQNQSKQSLIGKYNLNQYDLSEKSRKKRTHLQKLKAMDISIPGFQSSQRRTVFNISKAIKLNNQKLKNFYFPKQHN